MIFPSKFALLTTAASLLVLAATVTAGPSKQHSTYQPTATGPIGYDEKAKTFYGQALGESDAFDIRYLTIESHKPSSNPSIHNAEGFYRTSRVKIRCGDASLPASPSASN